MKNIILSPPVSNHLESEYATSVLGTFTLYSRPHKLWKILSTLRYDPYTRSFENNVGLRNPGIYSLLQPKKDNIISLHGFNEYEWMLLVQAAEKLNPLAIELNVSCPNVKQVSNDELVAAIEISTNQLIVKLAPYSDVSFFFDLGVSTFHLCNSFHGTSGKKLQYHSLKTIEQNKKKFGDQIEVIGGGGISSISDIRRYENVGCSRFSLSSMLLNPFNWYKIRSFYDCCRI